MPPYLPGTKQFDTFNMSISHTVFVSCAISTLKLDSIMHSHHFIPIVLCILSMTTGLEAQSASDAFRISAKVSTVKKQKSQSGDYDDKIQRMSFRIDLQNEERTRAFVSGNAIIVAFADDVQDRDEMIVIAREEFSVSIDPLKSASFETKQTKIIFDDKGYKYGQKYAGYLMVLKDASGSFLKVLGSSPALTKNVDAALKLKVEDVCNKKMEFVRKGYLRSS